MKSDDRWLETWSENLRDQVVLELGCGNGLDTPSIAKLAESVLACDLAPPQVIKGASKIMTLDHSKSLPFKNNNFAVVIASLCLHYFSWSITRNIVSEISRVLDKGGLLLCRLNSDNDINFGAQGHPEIETRLFNVHGRSKRFFSKSDIQELFPAPWRLTGLQQKSIDRYEKEKIVWEFRALNNKQ